MKNNYIRIRLTDEEKQLIKENAKQRNLNTSEYIRLLVYKDSINIKFGMKGADNGTI